MHVCVRFWGENGRLRFEVFIYFAPLLIGNWKLPCALQGLWVSSRLPQSWHRITALGVFAEWMNDRHSEFHNCSCFFGNGDLWSPPHIVDKIPVCFLDLSSFSSVFWITYVRRWLSFLFDVQQHPKSFLERTEEFAEKVLWGKVPALSQFSGSNAFYSHTFRPRCT